MSNGKIPEDHVKSVCLGAGKGACAYLMAGPNGWECAKSSPEWLKIIKRKISDSSMSAKGDYCLGPNFESIGKELN